MEEKWRYYYNQIRDCDMSKPFVFVSYSKMDKEQVYPLVVELQQKGCNLWIDKALNSKAGESWTMYMGQALKSPNCKVVIYMISRNSLNSVPILEELCYATKSETIKENNAGQPLKVLPVVIDKEWPKTNDDRDIKTWINNVVSLDNQPLNSSDLTMIQNLYLDLGRGSFKKNIYSGFDRIERKGQVSKTICSEILESGNDHMRYGTDASSLTLIFNRTGVVTQIINNISKYLVISENPLPEQIKQPEEKIICKNCGNELNADAIFCNKCGQSVKETEQAVIPEKPQPEMTKQPTPQPTPQPMYNSSDYVNPLAEKNPKGKLSRNKIIAIAAAAVVCVAVAITVPVVIHNNNKVKAEDSSSSVAETTTTTTAETTTTTTAETTTTTTTTTEEESSEEESSSSLVGSPTGSFSDFKSDNSVSSVIDPAYALGWIAPIPSDLGTSAMIDNNRQKIKMLNNNDEIITFLNAGTDCYFKNMIYSNVDGYMYFLYEDNSTKTTTRQLYRVKPDDSDTCELVPELSYFTKINKLYLTQKYYIFTNDGILYKMARDGASEADEITYNGQSPTKGLYDDQYAVQDGYLYYVTKDNNNVLSIECLNLLTMEWCDCYISSSSEYAFYRLFVYNNDLYFLGYQSDGIYLEKRSADFSQSFDIYEWKLSSDSKTIIDTFYPGVDSNGNLKCAYISKYDSKKKKNVIYRCDLVGDGISKIGSSKAKVLTECDSDSFIHSNPSNIVYLKDGQQSVMNDEK